MRIITLEGSKASYQRLKHLSKLHDFGMELSDAELAPFRLGWTSHRGEMTTLLSLRRTPVAHVCFRQKSARLFIHEGYPADHDGLLLRALRNATALTDRMEQMRKQEDGPKTSLLVGTHEPFMIPITRERCLQSLMGARIIDPRVNVRQATMNQWISLDLRFNKNSQQLTLMTTPEGVSPSGARHHTHYPRRETFTDLFTAGGAMFDAQFDETALRDALTNTLPDLSNVNRHVIEAQYQQALDTKTLRASFTSTIRLGPWRHVMTKYDQELYFDDFCVLTMNGGACWFAADMAGIDIRRQALIEAAERFRPMSQAQALGAEISDFPKITAELIKDIATTVDVGYQI